MIWQPRTWPSLLLYVCLFVRTLHQIAFHKFLGRKFSCRHLQRINFRHKAVLYTHVQCILKTCAQLVIISVDERLTIIISIYGWFGTMNTRTRRALVILPEQTFISAFAMRKVLFHLCNTLQHNHCHSHLQSKWAANIAELGRVWMQIIINTVTRSWLAGWLA